MRRWAPALALALGLALLAVEPAGAQCSLCRTALGQQLGLADAFREGILFLLAVPFTLVGVVSLLFLREQRRVRDGSAEPPREPAS
jgi:hypothetical protein